MQFSTALLALVASTVSAAVLPRDNAGQWAVLITLGPDAGQIFLHAELASEEYDPEQKEVRSSCVEAENPYFHNCDRAAFDFSYDGETVNVQQTLASGVTLYGTAPFSVTTDIGAGRFEDSTTVVVSRATL